MSERLHLNESEPTPRLEGELFEKWGDGVDNEKRVPKPFDIELLDVYSEDELSIVRHTQSTEKANEIIERNHQNMVKNNVEIDKLNQRIIDISELSPDELQKFYSSEEASDSDKSIVFCIETLRKFIDSGKESFTPDEKEVFDTINKTTTRLDGFWQFYTRETLEKNGSHFKILTKKERESAPGSLEDIASAALESFIKNPNYDKNRVMEYDSYLYGIMLDCTKRTPSNDPDTQEINEEVNLEEFQDRVIESMSWNVLDLTPGKDTYTEAEIKAIRKQAASMQADYFTGHHFMTDRETSDYYINKDGEDKVNIYRPSSEEENNDYWHTFEQRIRENNAETFNYDEEIAEIEMKPWAEKIDLDEIEAINNDDSLSYEEKIVKITASVQAAFGINNTDENGIDQPIATKWFRRKHSKIQTIIREALGITPPLEEQDLPEDDAGAFYVDSEKAIYYLFPKGNKTKLTDWDISTVAHEMWHAKQHSIAATENAPFTVSNENAKERMYQKNNLAYNPYHKNSNNRAYYMQVMEREAYAMNRLVERELIRRKKQRRGKKALNALFSPETA
ncbi:hypothetical protein IKF87_01405 [Candidatus Saccharibacteria bacterium]|nr:hypothetical protein [Candidatus Saccharibacteria bacterium]